MSLAALHRRSAPVAIVALGTFLLSMAPHRAWAEAPKEQAPVEAPNNEVVADKPQVVDPNAKAPPPSAAEAIKDTPTVSQPTTIPSTDSEFKSLPTGENKSGVTSKAISVPKGPGTIQGMGESFSAQPSTGIATFSVPFALPKARGAAQPSLSLGYSSGSGSGVAGIGWDVSVPYIARQTDRGLPGYDDQDAWHPGQDRFVYNGGQELVPIGTLLPDEELPTWAAGWQYFRPRVEGSYLRFFWNRQQQLWRVQDKSGVILELGGDANALEVDGTKVFRWNLRRQIDAHANEVRYSYLIDHGVSYVSDIYDTPPAQGNHENLAAWAHHTRLVYEARPDPSKAFNRGWMVDKTLRLVRVDITSVRDNTTSTRQLLRRYHLGYDTEAHHSLLNSLQVEGRCSTPVFEANTGELDSTSCPRLPKMSFSYTHVGSKLVDGFEDIDTTLHHMIGSPKHSVDEEYSDLYDINSDGLPDVVAMMPGTYGSKHGLWLSSVGGNADKFGPQDTIAVQGVLGATASVITKHNPNLVALDLDADATIDLLHMPKVKTYSVYTPRFEGEWKWVGREIATADQLDAKIDFGSDASELRVMDVNGDGLVDVVKSGGTSFQVWFALGRYPGGDGLFGSATWTGPETASLSMAPVLRCVPWSGTPVRFSDADTKTADMNGDGLTDIVRVRQGDIRYWPGRGDGTFGTGPTGCAGGTFSNNSFIQMGSSPQYSDPNGTALHLDDVNGDGTSDLVQIRFDAVDVWLNIDGASWTKRRVLDNTPPSPAFQNRVRIVDMNGSGTRDILWGDGYDYKYIDLSGGKRPWTLSRVENGLGKSTDLEFTTSTAQMLAAEKAGSAWTRKAPMPLQMVHRVTVRDNLGTIGRPDGAYVIEYTYHDPVYDGVQREFRGFSKTDVKHVGDANSPTSVSTWQFILGDRPQSFGLDCSAIDYTQTSSRWRDNPQEALKGLAFIEETYNPANGAYLSTTAHSYMLRRLYHGLDGRGVYGAFEYENHVLLYDNAPFTPGSTIAPVTQVKAQDHSQGGACALQPDSSQSVNVQFRSTSGFKHILTKTEMDDFGNKLRSIAYGSNMGSPADEVITTETVATRVETPAHPFGEGNWSWRTTESWVSGSGNPTKLRKHTKTHYTSTYGDPEWTEAELADVVALDRTGWDGGATAPTPDSAAAAGWFETSRSWYDSFGNLVLESGANDRCREVEYEAQHALLPSTETVYAGVPQPTTFPQVASPPPSLTCGGRGLQSTAIFDRGFQAPIDVTEPSEAQSVVEYDGFGRMTRMYKPDPELGDASSVASLKAEYFLPDVTGRAVSILVTHTQDGTDETVETYHDTYAFVDGLGRTVVTLSEADPTADGFDYVVDGLTDYDAKGAARRKYLAWSYTGDAAAYDLSMAAPAKYAQQRYDAFGRAIETFGLDGTLTLKTRYHALSTDAWDAEDIGPGVHQGTYASEVKDGHGRVTRATERVRINGAFEERYVDTTYLPTGEVSGITRRRGNDSVARTVDFDTLGRMVANHEPNTSGGGRYWRYIYDNAGDLVGTSDARGCGVNYEYDAAGRLLREDYSPCEEHHPAYGSAPEVSYHYDEPDTSSTCFGTQDYTLGKLVSVSDRAAKTITRFDGRGRALQTTRRITGPDGSTSGSWYCKSTEYDGADRPKHETTGASVNVDPQGSWVNTEYSARRVVSKISSAYDPDTNTPLVRSIKRDADGLVTDIEYGDYAHTATAFDYDDLRRLRNLTTYRSNLPQGTPPGTGQMLLQDEGYKYDRVGNPTEIRDWRTGSEWPSGSKPVTRKMQYDDLYRLSRIDYEYAEGVDGWVDPYAAEVLDNSRPQPAPHGDFSDGQRSLWQTWEYDWLGNTSKSDDDTHGFYDRSLGTITNGAYTSGRYQFTAASNWPGPRPGGASIGDPGWYDAAGNLRSFNVERSYNILPADKCLSEDPCWSYQHFEYEWDEVGRLTRARRWDHDDWQSWDPDAELHYVYDASDNRVRKTIVDWPSQEQRHTVYIFNSLELRLAEFNGDDYESTAQTEVPYLFGHGVRLARVVHTAPNAGSPSVRVFLELNDHLGSTSVVLDRATGELVQRSTAYAYGAPESHYRPGRWHEFREEYRFTGKEDDIEVGLVYFGKRYLNQQVARWISPDPLAVHAPGKADLNLYAYVHGRVLSAVDPFGLEGIISYQKRGPGEYSGDAMGPARLLADSLSGSRVIQHTQAGGEVRTAVLGSQNSIDRIDVFGHAATGVSDPDRMYWLNDKQARAMAPKLSENAMVVVHGCGTIGGTNYRTTEFLSALPKGATLYVHRMWAGPGQAINWVKHQLVFNADSGKYQLETRVLRGADKVIDVIVPRKYVREFYEKAADNKTEGGVQGLKDMLANKNNNITDDVREEIQKVIDAREPKKQSNANGAKP